VKKKAVFNGYDNTVWFHFREMEFPENQMKRERLPVNKFYASPAMFKFLTDQRAPSLIVDNQYIDNNARARHQCEFHRIEKLTCCSNVVRIICFSSRKGLGQVHFSSSSSRLHTYGSQTSPRYSRARIRAP